VPGDRPAPEGEEDARVPAERPLGQEVAEGFVVPPLGSLPDPPPKRRPRERRPPAPAREVGPSAPGKE
jgi:hypothetical protein